MSILKTIIEFMQNPDSRPLLFCLLCTLWVSKQLPWKQLNNIKFGIPKFFIVEMTFFPDHYQKKRRAGQNTGPPS
jgi:hypothetical protein